MPDTLYDRVGGDTFFTSLVDRFYDAVERDPRLRPIYPDDLSGPRRHLALFLAQYWGGPPTYNQERGHPRLRMRHAPFVIGPRERDAWLEHMLGALSSSSASEADKSELRAYFETASTALINRFPEPGTPGASPLRIIN
jgi:hemoglobin